MRTAQDPRARLFAGPSLKGFVTYDRPRAVFFGCSGPSLTDAEARFFADVQPFGFILFKRNCESAAQVSALCGELRASVDRPDAPVLIDEEGGRVQRLGPPAWPDFPAAERYGPLYETDPDLAVSLVERAAIAQASQLLAMGITADAAPVLDLRYPGASAVVGERAYSGNPQAVTRLGAAVVRGLMAGGVMPVIKHMPGHGRASVDSHVGLPRIDADLDVLTDTDFLPFSTLSECPWGMVGHLLIEQTDATHPASCSPAVISQIIRGAFGFDGLLLTDDLSMGALSGGVGERAAAALAAGCDVAVHCNGLMDEMVHVAQSVGPLTDKAAERVVRAERTLADNRSADQAQIDVATEVEEIVQALSRA